MPTKPLDLPMQVAKAFARDMRAYHTEPDAMKRAEIAQRQLDALQRFQGPRDKKLRLHAIKVMFARDEGLQGDLIPCSTLADAGRSRFKQQI